MARAPQGKDAVRAPVEALSGPIAAGIRPSEAQRRYLERGLTQAGGKLPLFDRDGREVPKKTVESCVAHGWATPWVHNPIKPVRKYRACATSVPRIIAPWPALTGVHARLRPALDARTRAHACTRRFSVIRLLGT
jgi:hypothetical protein